MGRKSGNDKTVSATEVLEALSLVCGKVVTEEDLEKIRMKLSVEIGVSPNAITNKYLISLCKIEGDEEKARSLARARALGDCRDVDDLPDCADRFRAIERY